jgi:hypothetical protein
MAAGAVRQLAEGLGLGLRLGLGLAVPLLSTPRALV